MRDAPYLRAQAELCLEIASQMSDRASVERLKADAARYHGEATAMESGVLAARASYERASGDRPQMQQQQQPQADPNKMD